MNEGLIIDDAEDYAFYQSGLSADGCLEKLDDYTRKAIKRYGEILLEKQKEDFIKGFKGCCYCCEPVGELNQTLEKLLEQRVKDAEEFQEMSLKELARAEEYKFAVEEQKRYIKILEETMEKYKNIPIQRRLSKNDISTSVVRLSDREVFTKDNTDQRFYYIDKESLTKKYYTFEEVQKFIDHGLFAVLKHSNDPMWQKPLSTSNPIPNTTSP